jgi:rubrerythrin
MNMEQALRTALEFETKVRDVYRMAARDCGDQKGKKVFQVLADEEQQHLDYLQGKLLEFERSGRVTLESLKTAIPSRERIARNVDKLEAPLEQKECSEEIDLVSRALEVEQQTSDFYKRVVQELPAEHRALFEPFIEIEEGHLAIVQAELDNLRGLGFYFDYQEFDLESG